MTGSDGTTYAADSVIARRPNGITLTGADGITLTGADGFFSTTGNGITLIDPDGSVKTSENADERTAQHAIGGYT